MPSSGLRIFVSHSHADNEFGVRLVQSLRRAYGENVVWYDSQGGLYGGDNWWRKIIKELTRREVFIVVLSPDAVKSKWVDDEITMAWNQKNSSRGKTIIPILYRDCEIRADLKMLHFISFLPPNTYDKAFYEVMRALEAKFPVPKRTTRSLSPPSSRTYNRRPTQPLQTSPSAMQKRKTEPLPAISPPLIPSRRKIHYPGFPGYTPQDHQSAALRAARSEALREANTKESKNHKKASTQRLYTYEDVPRIRRIPYVYADNPLRSYLAQQIDAPVVRRSSRFADPEYDDNDDDLLLEPEQIDRANTYLRIDEHPEIPRVRRASAHYNRNHTRKRKDVIQNYISSLSNPMMRNTKIAYFTISIILVVMILAILLFAPFLAGISLLILILATSALLATTIRYFCSHYYKK